MHGPTCRIRRIPYLRDFLTVQEKSATFSAFTHEQLKALHETQPLDIAPQSNRRDRARLVNDGVNTEGNLGLLQNQGPNQSFHRGKRLRLQEFNPHRGKRLRLQEFSLNAIIANAILASINNPNYKQILKTIMYVFRNYFHSLIISINVIIQLFNYFSRTCETA